MNFKEGDKLASDDYSAIGIFTKIGSNYYIISDFGKILYDECSDWQHYNVWLNKLNK